LAVAQATQQATQSQAADTTDEPLVDTWRLWTDAYEGHGLGTLASQPEPETLGVGSSSGARPRTIEDMIRFMDTVTESIGSLGSRVTSMESQAREFRESLVRMLGTAVDVDSAQGGVDTYMTRFARELRRLGEIIGDGADEDRDERGRDEGGGS
jgi:hypothetical protein